MSRTYAIGGGDLMRGQDVKDWQQSVETLFNKYFGIKCPIKKDGIYGTRTRSYTAALVKSMGMTPEVQMKKGVTPELRSRLRNKDLTAAQKRTMKSAARKAYRAKLREQWKIKKVHPPVNHITTDAWGYHPGVHDGIDVNSTRPGLPVFAMVKGRIIDVRMGDWWGKAPSGNVALGDGIVQLEVLENVGPFKKGQHIGYGHTEQPGNRPLVKVGDVVEAGDQIGSLGLAVTPHVHLMLNDGTTTRGVGNLDPRACLDYSVKHG